MTRASDRDTPRLGPWPRGSNNVAREDSVPRGSYRLGVNVDTYPGGKLRRRAGTTEIDPEFAENLWSDGSYALCTNGPALQRFTPGLPRATIFSGMTPYELVSYAAVNQFVYVSDGRRAYSVNMLNDTVTPWGVATPAGQPTLVASSGGGLDEGRYQVAITYVRASGEESGAAVAAVVNVSAGGGIALTSIPQPFDDSVVAVKIYMTRANGVSFLYYGSIGVGTLTTQLYKQHLGYELETMQFEPMPAGRNPVFAGGRLYVTVENMLVWSEPLRYGLFDPKNSFVQYASDVDLIAPTTYNSAVSGMFVGASKSMFFLAGNDPTKWVHERKYHSSAVPGSLIYLPGSMFNRQDIPTQQLPVWLAQNGYVCVGLPNGDVVSLTEGRFAAAVGPRASVFYRDMRGIAQAVFAMPGPVSTSHAVAADVADTILIRNGIQQ